MIKYLFKYKQSMKNIALANHILKILTTHFKVFDNI